MIPCCTSRGPCDKMEIYSVSVHGLAEVLCFPFLLWQALKKTEERGKNVLTLYLEAGQRLRWRVQVTKSRKTFQCGVLFWPHCHPPWRLFIHLTSCPCMLESVCVCVRIFICLWAHCSVSVRLSLFVFNVPAILRLSQAHRHSFQHINHSSVKVSVQSREAAAFQRLYCMKGRTEGTNNQGQKGNKHTEHKHTLAQIKSHR